MRLPSIRRLFFVSGPLAVFGFIVTLIVYSLYGKTLGGFSHIFKKVHEIQPSLTDGYSPSAITEEILVFWIQASGLHSVPDAVSSGMPSTMSNQIENPSLQNFQPMTTAGSCSTSDQLTVSNYRSIATFAETQGHPFGFASRSSSWGFVSNYFEASKRLTNEGYCFRHGIASFNVVFSGGRPASTGAHCEYAGKPLTLQA